MKLAFLFHISVLTIPFVEAKFNRLGLFRKYHRNRNNSEQWTKTEVHRNVRNNICNAKTCIKCSNVFKNLNGVSRKMQASCATIFKLRACCPREILKQF